jgi:hypothetical protein
MSVVANNEIVSNQYSRSGLLVRRDFRGTSDTTRNPTYYANLGQGITSEWRNGGDVGLPVGYAFIETLTPYSSDGSGGWPTQRGMDSSSDAMWTRYGTNATTWSSWSQRWFASPQPRISFKVIFTSNQFYGTNGDSNNFIVTFPNSPGLYTFTATCQDSAPSRTTSHTWYYDNVYTSLDNGPGYGINFSPAYDGNTYWNVYFPTNPSFTGQCDLYLKNSNRNYFSVRVVQHT